MVMCRFAAFVVNPKSLLENMVDLVTLAKKREIAVAVVHTRARQMRPIREGDVGEVAFAL
jgi:hypothetical protein